MTWTRLVAAAAAVLAGDRMKDGSLDAFFFTGGAQTGAVAERPSSAVGIKLLPIEGAMADTCKGVAGLLPTLLALALAAPMRLRQGAAWKRAAAGWAERAARSRRRTTGPTR